MTAAEAKAKTLVIQSDEHQVEKIKGFINQYIQAGKMQMALNKRFKPEIIQLLEKDGYKTKESQTNTGNTESPIMVDITIFDWSGEEIVEPKMDVVK
jgi:hypothetical protein